MLSYLILSHLILSIYLSIYLSIDIYIYISISTSISISIYRSIYPSIYLFYLNIYIHTISDRVQRVINQLCYRSPPCRNQTPCPSTHRFSYAVVLQGQAPEIKHISWGMAMVYGDSLKDRISDQHDQQNDGCGWKWTNPFILILTPPNNKHCR